MSLLLGEKSRTAFRPKSIYVLCVDPALMQFVEATRARPEPLAGSGSSRPLQLSSFRSKEEIWGSGCRQAEDDAEGGFKLVVVIGTLIRGEQPVRAKIPEACATKTAEAQGECRDKRNYK